MAEVEDWAVGLEKVLERIGSRFTRFDVDPVEHEQLIVCRSVGHSVTPAGRLPEV